MIGKRIAHYEVLEKIGEGGMGEVYRARDTRLGREVALKVLPAVFVEDAERLARIEREAKVLAALNHTNIAAIHGMEVDGQGRVLVMELALGEDLSQILTRGAIPWAQALPIALGIAAALETAHERGVIHRDLKPANVKVAPDGHVKVLDFGLAKAIEGDPAGGSSADMTRSPTITAYLTGASVILGTAAYMSPEQARGGVVDRRADIWSFGVVLFEILSGRRLFQGETVSDTLASVLKTEVDWSALPGDVPPALRRLLERCLERNPRSRLRDIGEARIALERIQAGETGETVVDPAAEPGWRRRAPWLAMGALAGALVAAFLIRLGIRPEAAPLPPHRLLSVAETSEPGETLDMPAISPDGERVVFMKDGALWVREMNHLEPRELPGTEGGSAPFWSPTGDKIGYFQESWLKTIDLAGGRPVGVCNMGKISVGGHGGDWGEDGSIVFSSGNDDVFRVSARGGEPTVIAATDTTSHIQDYHEPSFLPGGRGVLTVPHVSEPGRTADSIALLLPGGKRKTLLTVPGYRLWKPVCSPAGCILFSRTTGNPGVWAAPFDLKRLEVTGDPVLVAPHGTWPGLSRDGSLIYLLGGGDAPVVISRLDRSGRVTGTFGEPDHRVETLALSPDGARLVCDVRTESGSDLWLWDLTRNTRRRLTFTGGYVQNPTWSPDGRKLAYTAGSTDPTARLCVVDLDATDRPDTVAAAAYTAAFTPDGRNLVYAWIDEEKTTSYDLWTCSLTGSPDPHRLVQGPSWQYWGRVSPKGGMLAYISRESGRDEVYLTRYPSGSGKWQVSTEGGQWVRWNAAGDRLYYVGEDTIYEVEVDTRGAAPEIGRPVALFTRPATSAAHPFNWWPDFEVDGTGQTFYVFTNPSRASSTSQVVLEQGWIPDSR